MDTPQHQSPRPQPPEDTEQIGTTIMLLSDMVDLIGLRAYIIKKTPKGKSREPDQWAHTRAYMKVYANPANTEPLIGILEGAGCTSDVSAVRWLLKHDELVP